MPLFNEIEFCSCSCSWFLKQIETNGLMNNNYSFTIVKLNTMNIINIMSQSAKYTNCTNNTVLNAQT